MPCGTSILAVFCQWSVFQRTFDRCSPGIQIISHTLYPNHINVDVLFGTWWHLPRQSNRLPGRRSLASFSTHPEARGSSRFSRNVQALALARGKETGFPFFGDLWEISILIPTCIVFFCLRFSSGSELMWKVDQEARKRWDQGGKGW